MAMDHGVGSPSTVLFSTESSQTEFPPIQSRLLRSSSSGLDSGFDFNFCAGEVFDQESSSADELFSAWKNIQAEIKKNSPKFFNKAVPPLSRLPLSRQQAPTRSSGKKIEKQSSRENDSREKESSKSFWGFKRSSSCGSGYSHGFCPLPLLSRSNSTGSSSPPHATWTPLKQNSHRTLWTSSKKPPLKKNQGLQSNGVQISPILNVDFGSMLKNKTKKK